MTLANAHALFKGLRTTPSYLASLELDPSDRQRLKQARSTVRTALRDAAYRLNQETQFWDSRYLIENGHRVRDEVTVKFLTQGSWAYKTLNDPAQPLHQEVDLDDGMYVPVRYIDESNPALSAAALFDFVEVTLKPVCAVNGWSLDYSKDVCVRVKLWIGAHLDIPIYSVPDAQFELMKAARMEAGDLRMSFADGIPKYATIPTDKVMLAQRSGVWVQSDPKSLHDWVDQRAEVYGPVYRRVCRFFKGWRDETWVDSPLKSICLMVAIDAALMELDDRPPEDRDDKVILDVACQLPIIFAGQIDNPVVADSCLNNWSRDERNDVVTKTRELVASMESALERTGDADQVVAKLRGEFGKRLPNRPDVVKIAGPEAASIRSTPAAKVATPSIISSKSG